MKMRWSANNMALISWQNTDRAEVENLISGSKK